MEQIPLNILVDNKTDNLFDGCRVRFTSSAFTLAWVNDGKAGMKEKGQLFARVPTTTPANDEYFTLEYSNLPGRRYRLRPMADSGKSVYARWHDHKVCWFGDESKENTPETSSATLEIQGLATTGNSIQVKLMYTVLDMAYNFRMFAEKPLDPIVGQPETAVKDNNIPSGSGTTFNMTFTEFGQNAWSAILSSLPASDATIACCLGAASEYDNTDNFAAACAKIDKTQCANLVSSYCSKVGFDESTPKGAQCAAWCQNLPSSQVSLCMKALEDSCSNPALSKSPNCSCTQSNSKWQAMKNKLCPSNSKCPASFIPACFNSECYNRPIGQKLSQNGICPSNVINSQKCIANVFVQGDVVNSKVAAQCMQEIENSSVYTNPNDNSTDVSSGSSKTWIFVLVGVGAVVVVLLLSIFLLSRA